MTGKYRYFLYSRQQFTERSQVEAGIGMQYIPGKVLKTGRWRDYTEIVADPSTSRYSDAQIIAEGNLDNIQYKLPSKAKKTR